MSKCQESSLFWCHKGVKSLDCLISRAALIKQIPTRPGFDIPFVSQARGPVKPSLWEVTIRVQVTSPRRNVIIRVWVTIESHQAQQPRHGRPQHNCRVHQLDIWHSHWGDTKYTFLLSLSWNIYYYFTFQSSIVNDPSGEGIISNENYRFIS